ncbi:membrane protein [Streptomyces inusitatus]|uniref:Membrane protein n=1 Tax=Streptomyces inusitatus TaxID=68221 RepID=A0A918QD51_9ACTN|nr:DUF4190 domain-containing protein [Streptomyces inusitatus]GGZ42198.1 membrane protein [Streptomyces inusitatus]
MDPAQPGENPPPQPDPAPSPAPSPAPPFAPHLAPRPAQHPAYQAYPPHQQPPGYPAPPAVPPLSGLSVGSLVAGLVCCLPPLGLVLGLVALARIKKHGQRGRGMAIAGASLSAVSTALVGVLLVSGVAGDAWDGLQEGMEDVSRTRSTLDLRKGECVNLPAGVAAASGEAETAEVVDCAEKHELEITGTFKVTGYEKFPGTDPIETLASERCDGINSAYALDPWAVEGKLDGYYLMPTKQSWRLGDRGITCGLVSSDGDRTAGSARRDATVLDAHQLLYLKAEQAVEEASGKMPEAEYEDDPEAHRSYAREASEVFGDKARALREHDWPGKAAGAVAARAAQLEKARTEWDKAVRGGADDYWIHASAALEAPGDGPKGVAARRALGLAHVPPPEEPEGSESSEAPEEGAPQA